MNALALFVTLHFVLEVPMEDDPWRYVIYVMILLVFAIVAAVSASIGPMLCSAIGAFVTFWRVSAVLGESDVAYLLRFAGMALLGAGKSVRARSSCGRLLSLKIIVRVCVCDMAESLSTGAGVVLGAAVYAKETSSLKAYIDARLQRFKPTPKAAKPTAVEKEAIVPEAGSI